MIPSTVRIKWLHDGRDVINKNAIQTFTSTLLQLRNLQPSDAGVYQCVFNDTVNGWILKRNIMVDISKSYYSVKM